MHSKMPTIVTALVVTVLMLSGSGSAVRSADAQALERVLERWAAAWSSGDVEKVLALFTDNVVYEDVTFGSVNHGTKELHEFANFNGCRLSPGTKSDRLAANGTFGQLIKCLLFR